MQLQCTKPSDQPLSVGKEYHLTAYAPGFYMTTGDDGIDTFTTMAFFETPIERFQRLIPGASKVVIPNFNKDFRHDLLLTDSYLIVYSHKPGSHYNIFGHHYKYYHDGSTGEFIADQPANQEKMILKQRLLKADLLTLQQIAHKKTLR